MTIDLRVNVDLARYADYRYEWLDDLAETIDRRIDEEFANRLAAEHWAADDRHMLETAIEMVEA